MHAHVSIYNKYVRNGHIGSGLNSFIMVMREGWN